MYGQSLYKSATCGTHVGDHTITPSLIRGDAGDSGIYPVGARGGSFLNESSYKCSETGFGGREETARREEEHQKAQLTSPLRGDPNAEYKKHSVSTLPSTSYKDQTSFEKRFAPIGEQETRVKAKAYPTKGDAHYKAPTPHSAFELSHGRAGVQRNTELPSTFDLAAGTAKATNHPPYYGGFIPASYRNDNAVQAALAEQPREGTKNFTLFELQCYSHHKAGFGGYRPRNAINDPGDIKETELTANGTKDAQMLRSLPGMPPVTRAHGIPAAMMHDFFQDGQITKSENGKFNAQTYFGKVRPLEGIPKVVYASRTTDGGSKFVN